MARVASVRSFADVAHLAPYHPALPAIAEELTRECGDGDARDAPAAAAFDGAGDDAAALSLNDYLVRLCKYSQCSPWVFPAMRVYASRFAERTGAALTSRTAHRVVLASFVVAVKLRDDVYYSNQYYAEIGGVPLRALNSAEAALLTALDWETHLSAAELAAATAEPARPAAAAAAPPPAAQTGAVLPPVRPPASLA
eukprot:gene11831-10232_t